MVDVRNDRKDLLFGSKTLQTIKCQRNLIFVGSILFIKGAAFEAEGNSTLDIGMVISGVVMLVGNFVWMAGSVKRWRL